MSRPTRPRNPPDLTYPTFPTYSLPHEPEPDAPRPRSENRGRRLERWHARAQTGRHIDRLRRVLVGDVVDVAEQPQLGRPEGDCLLDAEIEHRDVVLAVCVERRQVERRVCRTALARRAGRAIARGRRRRRGRYRARARVIGPGLEAVRQAGQDAPREVVRAGRLQAVERVIALCGESQAARTARSVRRAWSAPGRVVTLPRVPGANVGRVVVAHALVDRELDRLVVAVVRRVD